MAVNEFHFSVVIPTFNRWQILAKALDSVKAQRFARTETIVVDDGSSMEAPVGIRCRYPQVRILRQPANLGPGSARNRGLMEATNPWVVMLDDDDELEPDAFRRISKYISSMENAARYPVFQFGHSNARLIEDFRMVTVLDYLQGHISGDFLPVFQKNTALALNLSYPAVRIGCEHLLWWRLSERVAIPTWREQVASVGKDARQRLTSWRNQVSRAAEYARIQELTLNEFGDLLRCAAPQVFDRKTAGAAAYWMLAGEGRLAEIHLQRLSPRHRLLSTMLRILNHLPVPVVRLGFGAYRTWSVL